MISKWHVVEPQGNRRGCIVALPGRGVPANFMEKFCHFMGLHDSLVIVLEPDGLRWYPAPNGPDDQVAAVEGLERAVTEINRRLSIIQRGWHLRRSKIALVGFSAGSVMALQVLAASRKPFAACVSFAGAILEPERMPKATTKTPVLLRHAVDDDCFNWEERYLPMKKALIEKDYNVYVSEKPYGGHGIEVHDAQVIGRWLAPFLGYEKPYDVYSTQNAQDDEGDQDTDQDTDDEE